ncbi:uncharacterized protein BDZ99DRAFT_448917 [Mytilinidion resinicola]|uniref:GAR domain-containing protein n=1 Tax=Mytilinidion resinicola TaxID=574789 RepID=A0A6A6YDX7_9PEZI|nr:uncharacterized protein BDZ99DRAFT_448917 [Mytilinidion resinicola]KAF2806204.1 hypothetical protein BDZ99DRAFT_448917 [Mytilinidion resinicola]
MTELSSSTRFAPPIFQPRSNSPQPSPRRYGRSNLGSEDGNFRDISPSTTLRAFSETPIAYNSPEEHKIFDCVKTATPAEKDLGFRVAKAAERLKSWCQEIEQWGWSGTFEVPSEERREKRRKSVQRHINEHTKGVGGSEDIGLLIYWGSLLSAEVKAYEARIEDIEAERETLDIEELKGHILDIHGPNRSRPSSSYDTKRPQFLPLDDFSILVTQTLLQALPYLSRLKLSIDTWSTRLTILCSTPRFLKDLGTTRTALDLAWRTLDPPQDVDTSDTSFNDWKETLYTILAELKVIVSDLGQRLDRMLDILEGREDALPDTWIDDFEELESDYSRWTVESRNRILDVEIRRMRAKRNATTATTIQGIGLDGRGPSTQVEDIAPRKSETLHRASINDPAEDLNQTPKTRSNGNGLAAPYERFPDLIPAKETTQASPHTPTALRLSIPDFVTSQSKLNENEYSLGNRPGEQDDTVEGQTEDVVTGQKVDSDDEKAESVVRKRPDLTILKRASVTSIESFSRHQVRTPQTPQSHFGLRRDSVESASSSISLQSSPASALDDSPSVRNAYSRNAKVPKPPLNSAMAKRRPLKTLDGSSDQMQPWPPTKFAHALSPKKDNSTEDLERKISDILTTIPAHIRLTSGPEADAPEVKPTRVVSAGGRYASNASLRVPRSVKSPEPTLTLSPVKTDLDKSSNAPNSRRTLASGDSDIKLYHLTQNGMDKPPIKLFVRRVGENGERVMVRVGGGWADLGEYLRQYAEHHGRRTVSEGKFEVLGLENLTSSPAGMIRPDSRHGAGTPQPNPATSPARGTPAAKAAAFAAADSAFNTPASVASVGTPANANAEASSASTGSSRLSWGGNEVGLAGPKSKKLDLSGEKLEWIEGMMTQARKVSTQAVGESRAANGRESRAANGREGKVEKDRESRESKGEKDKGFGDLGRVGGTKRVFLRGGKPVVD